MMRTALISGLLALAGVCLAIPVGRHWSEARQEGGSFWTRTKLGFWMAVLALCLAYANLMAQFAPDLMDAMGVEDVSFLLLLRAYSPFSLFFLLLPALYALLYRRTLRVWKEGIYAELDRVQWDTTYTRSWGKAVHRSRAVHTGFFGFLKDAPETGRDVPDESNRRPEDVRIAGRPVPLQPAAHSRTSGHHSTPRPWHSHSYYRSGRYVRGHSFHHAPLSAPGSASTGGSGFQGMGGQGRGVGAGRSFASSSGGSFRSGNVSSLGSSLARSASGGGSFRSGGGKSRGAGAGRSFSESTGFGNAVRAGAIYNAGTHSGSPKISGGKSGSSGTKGKSKSGGGAAGVGAALLAALRTMLVFLLAAALVAAVLFAGYGTAWLVVNQQDRKHNFFQKLERMTLAHAGKLPAR